MAVTQAQSLEQLRVAVGRLLGAVTLGTATGGSTTTLVDTALRGGDGPRGTFFRLTSGTDDGVGRQASDYVQSTTTVTVAPAWATGPSNLVTYEEWDEWANPVDVEAAINQAILDATGFIFTPTEDISLFADRKTARFDVPTTFEMLRDVYIRARVTSVIVHDCDSDFDAVTDPDISTSNDDQDRKAGSSIRLVIGAGVSDGDFVAASFSPLDLRAYTSLEGWIKATSTLAAADFVVQLRETTATIRETLSVPATTGANIWTHFRIPLANPELDNILDHIYFEYNANSGANTVWFDDIKATINDEADWVLMSRNQWKIDKEARDLVFVNGGVQDAGYGLIKLKGGDNPLLLGVDSAVTEIPESYLIYLAAGLMAARPRVPEGVASRASGFLQMAERAKRSFPMLVNARFTQ